MFGLFKRHKEPPTSQKSGMTSADLAGTLFSFGAESSSGQVVTADRAMRASTVYACVRILAESVAQLPVKVYRSGQNGAKDVQDSGSLFTLLRFPNGWQNTFDFREYLMSCLLLHGNFYALKSWHRGEITALLPLNPGKVTTKRKNWDVTYEYTDDSGKRHNAGTDDILHIRGLSLDGFRGISPVTYMRDAIGLSMATENHGARVFRNGARPGGILKHPGKLSDEALEHLQLSWEASHGGDNAGGTAILEEGMDYAPVSMTNEDAQYLEARQFQRTEICSIFRVPPHMVGDLTKSSFSNIEQQSLEFVKYSVLPWCKRIETALWHSLLTEQQRQDGLHVEFLVAGLERADIKTRYDSYSVAIQNGILSPNECRRLENRNPREGGDTYLQPLNMTDGSRLGSANKDAVSQWWRIKAAGDEEEHEHDDWSKNEWSKEVGSLNEIVRVHQGELQSFFQDKIKIEAALVEGIIARHFGEKSAEHDLLISLEELYRNFPKELKAGLYPLLRAYIALVLADSAKRAGREFAGMTADIDKSILGYIDIYAQDHCAASLAQLQAIVRDSPPGLVQDVLRRRISEWQEKRAGKISRTESVAAANYYAREAYRKYGVQKLRWVTQGNKSCTFCKKLSGRIVGIEEAFLGKGEELFSESGVFKTRKTVKHPPVHRGCVCAIVPEFENRWEYVTGSHTDATGHLANNNSPTVDDKKFYKYCLDLESPNKKAKSKAEKFAAILGILQDDWPFLKRQVLDGLEKYRPSETRSDAYGEKYSIMMPVRGMNKAKAIVQTVWIFDHGSTHPRLVTLYIPEGRKREPHEFLLNDLED